MDPAALRIVSLTDAVIRRYYALSQPTPEFEDSIASLVSHVEKFLSERLNEDIRLDIFGSLKSGFGSLDSDIDVCLRFGGDEQPEDVKINKVMFRVAGNLQKQDFVRSALPITHAKVPIVKCEILKPLETSMDISYYNTLALENTRLLATYCAWEPERLPQLGLWVKKWAKEGGICDASMGFLSSYGCILLLIHYLQKCDPPVLPHLQEDYVQAEDVHSSGWNTYFYPVVETNWSRNKKSAGELFLDFLDYYTKFDFKQTVVQIRQKNPISKAEKREKEKKWRGRKAVLAIEDPFELDRNLCGGLVPNGFKRIRTYFERSAETLREAIEAVDIGAEDVDFKRELDEMLEKCHVTKEEIRKKKGKKEDGGEGGKKDGGAEKNVYMNKAERQKKRKDGAGSAVIRQTSSQKAAIQEMEGLLQAMYLGKENFPALWKNVTEQGKKQSSSADFWKSKNRANAWSKPREQWKPLPVQWRKKNTQTNAPGQQSPQKLTKAQRKALQQVQAQNNGPVSMKPMNSHPQQSHQKQQKVQNQAQKNGPAKKPTPPGAQLKPHPLQPHQKQQKTQNNAPQQAQPQKNASPKKTTPQGAQAKNTQTLSPPQQNLTKVQKWALKRIQIQMNTPAAQPTQKKPTTQPNVSQKKKKSAQESSGALKVPPQPSGEGKSKKKAKNAASASNPPPVAPTTASTQ